MNIFYNLVVSSVAFESIGGTDQHVHLSPMINLRCSDNEISEPKLAGEHSMKALIRRGGCQG